MPDGYLRSQTRAVPNGDDILLLCLQVIVIISRFDILTGLSYQAICDSLGRIDDSLSRDRGPNANMGYAKRKSEPTKQQNTLTYINRASIMMHQPLSHNISLHHVRIFLNKKRVKKEEGRSKPHQINTDSLTCIQLL